MNPDDASLQELIVRALTSRDSGARRTLERAAERDPELQKFCGELDELVASLSGAGAWRAEKPSADLAKRIREAVVARLPSAPPHFRTILLEVERDRQRSSSRVLWVALCAAVLLAGVGAYIVLNPGTPPRPAALKLGGMAVAELALKAEPAKAAGAPEFVTVPGMGWTLNPDGLGGAHTDDPGALILSQGVPEGAAALSVDVKLPELDGRSSVAVLLAGAQNSAAPAFDASARCANAIVLEFTADGNQATGPDGALLFAKPVSNARGAFYRVRIEHLGTQARILLNNEPVFDGPLPAPLNGVRHPAFRLQGPASGGVRFSALRLER